MTTTATEKKPDTLGRRLRDDHWCDEVRLVGVNGPVLRCITVPRYKTSGMSGDEWRTSMMWQTRLDMKGREPNVRTPDWFDLDGPYNLGYQTACAALYPGIFTSHPEFHDYLIHSVDFVRKGRVQWKSHHDGKPLTLLETCGHLPWACVLFRDQGMDRDAEWERSLCFQPGCAEPAVSTYRLKKEVTREGIDVPEREWGGYPWRRFCAKHGRRGDCGLEDCDDNYIVIEGPGPDGPRAAAGAAASESKSVFGGFVVVEPPK